MKIFLILLCCAFSLSAQNFAITFYPTNSAEAIGGIPAFWPKKVQPIGTNTTVTPPDVLLTGAELQTVFRTNQAAYDAWITNWNKIQLDADLGDFLSKMDKIETWIDRTSGSNTLSNAQRDNAINDICQTFKKLRRALVNLYKPE